MKTKADVKRTLGISLGKPGKMPCRTWNLPALMTCPAGRASIIEHGKSAVCSKCYARKGNYVFPMVQDALKQRYRSTFDDRWADAMVILIGDDPYFRWHDSGDIYSLDYLKKIIEVVRRTPNTKHWLPTREVFLVDTYAMLQGFPSNLTVRVSGLQLDVEYESGTGLPTSNVLTDIDDTSGYICPATTKRKTCETCRACWNKNINVVYKAH